MPDTKVRLEISLPLAAFPDVGAAIRCGRAIEVAIGQHHTDAGAGAGYRDVAWYRVFDLAEAIDAVRAALPLLPVGTRVLIEPPASAS